MAAEPFVHLGCTTGEFGLLFNHSHVINLFFLNGFCFLDNLIHDVGLVKVFNTFVEVDRTDHRGVLHDFFLVFNLLVFFIFVILCDENVCHLLLVGDFLGHDDFLGLFDDDLFFLFLDFFLFRSIERSDFLNGVDCQLIFIGFAEDPFIEKGEKDEGGYEDCKNDHDRTCVAGWRVGTKCISAELFVFAFEYYIAPLF